MADVGPFSFFRCNQTTWNKTRAHSTIPRGSLSWGRPLYIPSDTAVVAVLRTIRALPHPLDLAVTPPNTQPTPLVNRTCQDGRCPRPPLARQRRKTSISTRPTILALDSDRKPSRRIKRQLSATLAQVAVITPRNLACSRTWCRAAPASSATSQNGEHRRRCSYSTELVPTSYRVKHYSCCAWPYICVDISPSALQSALKRRMKDY